MEKLTKKVRHDIYIRALKIYMEYKPNNTLGLCSAISDAIKGLDLPSPYWGMRKYPEIQKHKPKVFKTAYWFDHSSEGTQKRIDILKQAIEETK
jgi:hypothetical protein